MLVKSQVSGKKVGLGISGSCAMGQGGEYGIATVVMNDESKERLNDYIQERAMAL